jgi:hypothetical protein
MITEIRGTTPAFMRRSSVQTSSQNDDSPTNGGETGAEAADYVVLQPGIERMRMARFESDQAFMPELVHGGWPHEHTISTLSATPSQ